MKNLRILLCLLIISILSFTNAKAIDTTSCTYQINDSSHSLSPFEYVINVDKNGLFSVSSNLKSGETSPFSSIFLSDTNKNYLNINDFSKDNKTNCPDSIYLSYCEHDGPIAGITSAVKVGKRYIGALFPTDVASKDFVNDILPGCKGKISQQALKITKIDNHGLKINASNIDEPLPNESSFKIKVTSCGGVDNIPASVPRITRNIYNVLKYLIPVILIGLGIMDFFRVFTSNDDKGMHEGVRRFIKRLISGILIFFVIAIVQLIFGMISDEDNTSGNIASCISCFINSEDDCGEVEYLVD